ncbi:S-layer homology domain-containing protein [Caldicellulosiruptoraceae bacterium PP1]
MKRKLSYLILMVFMLSFVFSGFAFASTDAKYDYDQVVNVLSDLNIVYSISKDYKLDSYLTRAELAQLVTFLSGVDEATIDKDFSDAQTPFTDINEHELYGYIAYATSKQIMSGRTAKVFAPNAPATVQEVATVLLRLLGAKIPNGKWPYNYLKVAFDLNIIPTNIKLGSILKKDAYLMVYNTLKLDKTQFENTKILQQVTEEYGIVTQAPKYDEKFVINGNEYAVSTDKDISALIGQRIIAYLVKRNVKDENSKWELIDFKTFEGLNSSVSVTLENPNNNQTADRAYYSVNGVAKSVDLDNVVLILNNKRVESPTNSTLAGAYVSLISNDGDDSTIEYIVGVKYDKMIVTKVEATTAKNDKNEDVDVTIITGFDMKTKKEISLKTKDLMVVEPGDIYNYTINNDVIEELYVAEERVAGTVKGILNGRIFIEDEEGVMNSFILSPNLAIFIEPANYSTVTLDKLLEGDKIVGLAANGVLQSLIIK